MVNRLVAPPFAKVFTFSLPAPAIEVLPNGLSTIQIKDVQQDIVKIELLFKAGKWYEPKPGISHFTAQMLEKGAASKSSQQIAEIIDRYGAQLEISSGLDFVSISLYSLSRNLESVFPLFMEVLTQPSFPEEELNLMKTIFKQNLRINNEKTSYLASKLIRKNIFGESHPYGSSIEEADVDKINRNDLAQYFKSHFTPFQVYITGNIPSKISWVKKALAQTAFRQATSPAINVLPSKAFSSHIPREGSTQSSIRLGKRIISRTHPDYPALFLLNHILGGYFGSRLMKNIREDKGLTYGIYSSINAFYNDSLFTIGADVNKDKIELTLTEIGHEFTTLKETEVPEVELQAARNHLLGSLQLEVANPFSVTEKIKNIQLNKLATDYYQTLFAKISSLTSKDLVKTANTYLSIEDLYKVSVG